MRGVRKKIEKLIIFGWKIPTKQRLFFWHKLLYKMKPFTDNHSEEYEPIADIFLSFQIKKFSFWRVNLITV